MNDDRDWTRHRPVPTPELIVALVNSIITAVVIAGCFALIAAYWIL